MLLMGLILLIAGTTLLGLTTHTRRFQEQARVNHLAHNLMETLLALPVPEAKAFHPEDQTEWTDGQHYTVQVTWEPYTDPHFEKLRVEYSRKQHALIQLVTLVPAANKHQ
jgi:hypothetical protein